MLLIILFKTIHFIQTALLYLVMSYPLFRSVYKEIAKIEKKDTFLAQAIRKNVKTHVATFYASRERMSKKFKKQEDHQLLYAFLNFLKLVNLSHQHKGYIAEFKLVEMVLGLNCEVDEHFNLRKNQKSIEIKFLSQYEQYIRLSAKDKEFVQSIIKKVFQGEETYNHPNLTSFFQDQKANHPQQNKLSESTPIKYQLDPIKRKYLEKVINGEVSGVSKQIIKMYSQILNNKCSQKSNFDMILQSYEQSNYILLDFDDLTIKK